MINAEQQRVWDILSAPFVHQSQDYDRIKYQMFMRTGDQYLMVTMIPTMVALNGRVLTPGTEYLLSVGSTASTISFSHPMTYGDVVTLY